MATNSVFRSRFFARRTSSQKELRSGRGADWSSQSNFDYHLAKISSIEKIKNLQRRSESKLNVSLLFISFFLPPNYDNFVVQYI